MVVGWWVDGEGDVRGHGGASGVAAWQVMRTCAEARCDD